MPEIEVQHVVSCSSADKNNPAENLLKPEGSHKWKCATAGEKNPSIVLQLSKSAQINSIDIGNEGSAFVEVLVGKATAAADTDFEVLLVASSFMSPLESRDGTNRTAVRMFGPEKLNKTAMSEKWDRVKIVCTQPFSKTSQYGLSFIKFHSPPSSGSSEPSVKKFGSFSLKDNDDDNIRVGSLFANRSKVSESPVPTGAAAMRAATRLADEQVKTSSPPHKITSPFANLPPSKLAYLQSNSSTPTSERKEVPKKRPAESPPHHSKAKMPRASHSDSDSDEEPKKTKIKTHTSAASNSSTSDRSVDRPAAKRPHTESSKSRPPPDFSRIMSRVIFVLSGFQNPIRGQLRDQAMEMGAKYKSDWDKSCTHLVCAFSNTPKYQQVSGKGKIVNKGWVMDSYRRKELQPWKKYRLGDAQSPAESSESEEEVAKAQDKRRPSQDKKKERSSPSSNPSRKDHTKKPAIDFQDSDSGGDTEDELRKAREINERKKLATKMSSKQDVDENKKDAEKKNEERKSDVQMYDKSTDEDEPGPSVKEDSSDSGFPDLPEFFTDKHFFFYGEFPEGEKRLLTRYIAAYNGELEDYMSKRVQYVITAQKWDDNFESALNENPQLIFVKPQWIFSCHKKLQLLPFQPYNVVPQYP